ncbi:MAG: hypothetical protein Q9175_002672 [Cornicularia normoerica]
MASYYLRKLCSLFHQQTTKKDETHTFHTTNGVFGDWTTSAVEDLPPPYADSPEEKTHFQDQKTSPSPSFANSCLQICPHQAVSFEDLKEAISSAAIKDTRETIDALTLHCQEHRRQSDPAAGDARNVCVSSPGFLRGFGTYSYENPGVSGCTPRVVLSFNWDLGCLDGVRGQVETAAELQQFLSADGIWLCPHKRVNDSDIVNAIYGFVKRPSRREVRTGCGRCETEIKIVATKVGNDETCRVITERSLGTLEKPDCPVWHTQCGA